MDSTAAHSGGYSCWTSAAIRTVRSRSSGGYLLFVAEDMTPSLTKDEVMYPEFRGVVIFDFSLRVDV